MSTRPRGRPTLYRDEYAEEARKLCLLGATDAQMADFWGVSVQTYYDWQKAHPEFLESIMRGKILADAEVADKLHQRALGYVVNATKLYRQDDGSVLQVPFTIEHPPDTQAASLWLRNRQPRLWRDKHEVDVTDAGESLLDGMSEEQLVELLMLRRGVAQRKLS
jgi:hypothetical protein